MSIMLSRAEKGLWNGAPVPIGYDWDEETEFVKINEEEAKTVRLIYDLYEKTGSSADVLHYLELHNIATKRAAETMDPWELEAFIETFRDVKKRYNEDTGEELE